MKPSGSGTALPLPVPNYRCYLVLKNAVLKNELEILIERIDIRKKKPVSKVQKRQQHKKCHCLTGSDRKKRCRLHAGKILACSGINLDGVTLIDKQGHGNLCSRLNCCGL